MRPTSRQLPPLNALRAFEVAGRRLSFRAAADELGVTQGAVSQQVRGLEEHLGFPLFQRMARGLALTERGAAYLADIRRAFDLMTEATEAALARPQTVTVSVTPTFASKWLIPRLPRLTAVHPQLDLRIVATAVVSDFDRDGIDLAVRLTRPPVPAGLSAKLLFRQEVIAVASPAIASSLTLPLGSEQLARLSLLHDSVGGWPAFLDDRVVVGGLHFNQTTLAIDAALAGQGVALACREFVAPDLQSGRLVQVSERVLTAGSDYFLVTPARAKPREGVRQIMQWLEEEAMRDTSDEQRD